MALNINQARHYIWPQGNGQAENSMKRLVKAVKSAHHENKDWKREMFKFLLNYRATPYATYHHWQVTDRIAIQP